MNIVNGWTRGPYAVLC